MAMTLSTINLGVAPDDGTGDPLRSGGQRINGNFGVLKRHAEDGDGWIAATGTGNVYVLDPRQTIDALAAPLRLTFRADRTSSGSVSVRVSGLASAPVYMATATGLSRAGAGAVRHGGIYDVVWSPDLLDGEGAWVMLNPSVGGATWPGPLIDLGAVGSSATVDPADGNRIRLVLDAAVCALTLGDAPDSSVTEIRLFLYRSGTGARGVAWPASVIWLSGSAPELGTVGTAPDIIELITHDGGETWLGWRLGCCGAAAEAVVPVISIGSITI